MLARLRRPVATWACAAAAVLTSVGCRLETDCTETRLLVEPVDASEPAELILTARLVTDGGDPVPDRVVEFNVRTDPDGVAMPVTGGRTAPDGVATGDAYTPNLPFPQTHEELRAATVLYVEYSNPDDLNSAAQPNYCSAETTVAFRWTGSFPSPGGSG